MLFMFYQYLSAVVLENKWVFSEEKPGSLLAVHTKIRSWLLSKRDNFFLYPMRRGRCLFYGPIVLQKDIFRSSQSVKNGEMVPF